MKESYKSFDELPMMLSVSQVAKVLGISRTRSYELVNEICTQIKITKPTPRFTICRTKSLMKTFRRTNL